MTTAAEAGAMAPPVAAAAATTEPHDSAGLMAGVDAAVFCVAVAGASAAAVVSTATESTAALEETPVGGRADGADVVAAGKSSSVVPTVAVSFSHCASDDRFALFRWWRRSRFVRRRCWPVARAAREGGSETTAAQAAAATSSAVTPEADAGGCGSGSCADGGPETESVAPSGKFGVGDA
jgi:hypothetical protein